MSERPDWLREVRQKEREHALREDGNRMRRGSPCNYPQCGCDHDATCGDVDRRALTATPDRAQDDRAALQPAGQAVTVEGAK